MYACIQEQKIWKRSTQIYRDRDRDSDPSRVPTLFHHGNGSGAWALAMFCPHGHGHGVFILATSPTGKWTTNPTPSLWDWFLLRSLSPSIPAQALQRALVLEARSPSADSKKPLLLRALVERVGCGHSHGHGHGLFILATYHGLWLSINYSSLQGFDFQVSSLLLRWVFRDRHRHRDRDRHRDRVTSLLAVISWIMCFRPWKISLSQCTDGNIKQENPTYSKIKGSSLFYHGKDWRFLLSGYFYYSFIVQERWPRRIEKREVGDFRGMPRLMF